MKKLLLILIAALAPVLVAPAAHAYERDTWHEADKILHDLYPRMDAVDAKRDRFGASPRMRDQIAALHVGMRDVKTRIGAHIGDPRDARRKAMELTGLMSQVEAEFRARIHHGVFLSVNPG